ncbi:hypothetical protein SAMD00019534_083610 [Acytostelium subglobosum LB1]|uniref:hypothetical protein n=1 Tax=Acytostelium subglobosum LB1 TaxID=1410327 RepID=UPI000644927D|nr:hypothetical protein SAMD00019534_083610 [Acytostelium subglobosum LB1]GAM25186.1 hypothetical protein SAMD00019534_083610 [Acytostelium subglobosum LB1]|eukprot:XP_012751706.1 hypothetical protein SAMD00019534_083610 [Acytostelium subglobosum LB1]
MAETAPQYQPTELDPFYALFANIDPVQTHTYNLSEFKAAFQAQLGFSDSTLEGMFKACDVDRDGRIDLHEFLSLICIVVTAPADQKLVFLFHLFDKDRSGSLENKEVIHIVDSLANVAKAGGKTDAVNLSADDLIKADTNNDGVISLDEFVNFGLSNAIVMNLLKGY